MKNCPHGAIGGKVWRGARCFCGCRIYHPFYKRIVWRLCDQRIAFTKMIKEKLLSPPTFFFYGKLLTKNLIAVKRWHCCSSVMRFFYKTSLLSFNKRIHLLNLKDLRNPVFTTCFLNFRIGFRPIPKNNFLSYIFKYTINNGRT